MPSHLRFCQSKPGNNHINTHHEHKKQEVQIAKTLKKNINNLIVPENISPNEITKAMSNVNSIFKNPQTLTDEFNRQYLLVK